MNLGEPPQEASGTIEPHELVARLYELDQNMPEALYAQFLAAGGAVVPELTAILEAEMADEQVDQGCAPLHAADLLGALGDVQAVSALIRCLAGCDKLDFLYQKVINALVALGQIAVDRCLDAYATTTDGALRDRLIDVFGRSPTHDERIYEALLDTLERSPELGAMYLAEYGDARALPALSQAFDALPLNDDSLMGNHVFVELRSAIEDLGGQLTAEQAAKAKRADLPRRLFAAEMYQALDQLPAHPPPIERMPTPPSVRPGPMTRKPRKIGRNERCWCGSGKKYKKCHLDLDR